MVPDTSTRWRRDQVPVLINPGAVLVRVPAEQPPVRHEISVSVAEHGRRLGLMCLPPTDADREEKCDRQARNPEDETTPPCCPGFVRHLLLSATDLRRLTPDRTATSGSVRRLPIARICWRR